MIKLYRTSKKSRGFTLIELVITVTLLSVLTLAAVPLAKTAVKRQKEYQLREALRQMRVAIDEFHRDAVPPAPNINIPIDPRSRVFINDPKIFTTDNPDRYPPDLETLVNGVIVKPRGVQQQNMGGGQGLGGTAGVLENQEEATKEKTKVYLRRIPIDPITGEAEWELRSCYDEKDAVSWGRQNVFDVRSKSTETALDGTKYSEW